LKCRFGSDQQVDDIGVGSFTDNYLGIMPARWISSHMVECTTPVLFPPGQGTVPKTVEVANEPIDYNPDSPWLGTACEEAGGVVPAGIPTILDQAGLACNWEFENWIPTSSYVSPASGMEAHGSSIYQYSADSIVFLYSSTAAAYCKAQGDLLNRGYVGAGDAAIFEVQAYNEQNDPQTTGNDIFYVNGDFYGEVGVYGNPGASIDFDFLLRSRGIVICGVGEVCVLDCPEQNCPNCPETCEVPSPNPLRLERCRSCLQPAAAKAPIIELVVELRHSIWRSGAQPL
jgi:hypothetical protein